MRIAVVGGGGREHAIIKKIKQSPLAGKIYALPGNGGIASDAECVPIGAKELDKIVEFSVNNKIDFVVVAPDDPLVLGLADKLHERGIKCFGPVKAAAAIEGSKAFAKSLMKKYGIPTAKFETFSDMEDALAYVRSQKPPVVVKADGLALGKGVIIAQSTEEAEAAVRSMMLDKVFGESGSKIVIEEFLSGPEVSVLSFTDGKTVVPMVSSMDHKRAFDGDVGPNTGGMGTVAPNPYYTKEIAARCMEEIFLPTIDALNKEGKTFRGCLYFGLMLTDDGPKVIEYNCRFGDPETQVVLPLMENDLLETMLAVEEGRLSDIDVKFSDKNCCCVVVASDGYPKKYSTGYELKIGDISSEIYIAGAKLDDGKLLTSGGRVAGISAVSDILADAIKNAYKDVDKVNFENKYYRKDIGAKCLVMKK